MSEAAFKGDVPSMQKLIAKGASVNQHDQVPQRFIRIQSIPFIHTDFVYFSWALTVFFCNTARDEMCRIPFAVRPNTTTLRRI
jgi:hypothetical protein